MTSLPLVANLCPGQGCRFGVCVTSCTDSRCASAAITLVCLVLAAQAPIITVMLSGIHKAMQQMLEREMPHENFVSLTVYNRYPSGAARFG